MPDSVFHADVSDPVERLTAEGLVSMSAAARLYGSSRGTTPTHKSTPARHAMHGVRLPDGRVLKLEAIRVNGRLMTSRLAVLRFFAAQQQTDGASPAPPAEPPRSPTQRSAPRQRRPPNSTASASRAGD